MMECKSDIFFWANLVQLSKTLLSFSYKGKDDFKEDVEAIFKNCQVFNEDDSPVGKCGKNMKTFFQRRWTDLTAWSLTQYSLTTSDHSSETLWSEWARFLGFQGMITSYNGQVTKQIYFWPFHVVFTLCRVRATHCNESTK